MQIFSKFRSQHLPTFFLRVLVIVTYVLKYVINTIIPHYIAIFRHFFDIFDNFLTFFSFFVIFFQKLLSVSSNFFPHVLVSVPYVLKYVINTIIPNHIAIFPPFFRHYWQFFNRFQHFFEIQLSASLKILPCVIT